METDRRFGDWLDANGETAAGDDQIRVREVRRSISKAVITEIKKLHQQSPKYVYSEESQSRVLQDAAVEILRLDADYAPSSTGKCILISGEDLCTAEQFAARHFKTAGYEVLTLESIPFHVLFGVYMWILIQDLCDPNSETRGFGNRDPENALAERKIIWMRFPIDFGTSSYAVRRKLSIEAHFAAIREDRSELLWLFDYWLEPSWMLRQYLWAHKQEDIARAREVVSLLPPNAIIRILRYLVGDYWKRFCGWPDLLVHRGTEFFLVEVKSSQDKLSEDQKRWIRGNRTELNLPFKLVKIHRATPA